jgi:hypothetical protein
LSKVHSNFFTSIYVLQFQYEALLTLAIFCENICKTSVRKKNVLALTTLGDVTQKEPSFSCHIAQGGQGKYACTVEQ